MPDGNVLVLPGTNRPDLQEPTPTGDVLRGALEADLIDVAIVGRQTNGDIAIWGSNTDADAVIGLFHRAIAFLANAKQESG